MIERVLDAKKADFCDQLLTKLINDEQKYDDSIKNDFVVKDYFKNIIKDDKKILLSYIDNNIIVGYIFLKPIINDNDERYLIDGLYVEEAYRNNGIGKKLINYSLNILSEMNVKYVEINVLYKNITAKNLYKNLGFDKFKINMLKEL